ncbi:protein SPA, chloroplastic [Selaginella moellendorffii]|uniref:protein SPA, chloroplastic n=1 Tax=Selaginella moellendorffii TaxID=88036 RepID=UPI000D1C3FA9|nr:protein SPA, chloroplastic [Selaginella moellendorffii]|eukprot:XP_002984678.2 protein SPA, chloroplastic [Selaginella moellendorffii]
MATVSYTPASLSLPSSLSRAHKKNIPGRNRRRILAPIRALELDQDTLLAVGVGLAGIAVGIGIPVFYETQVKGAEKRINDQPCFPCSGTGSQTCRFCVGSGSIAIALGSGESEKSKCVNCDGAGSITCTTCQGTGIQPRFLDRREFKDDD